MREGFANLIADRRFEAWHDEGLRRFGIFPCRWFQCPRCGLAFTPEHAAEVGVPDNFQASTCPEALGGCGWPHFGCWTKRAYQEKFKTFRMPSTHGMVGIAKDGAGPAFHVFPYCPAELVPGDGKPAVVGPNDPFREVRKMVEERKQRESKLEEDMPPAAWEGQ